MPYEYTRESELPEETCVLITPKTITDEFGVKKSAEPERIEVFCRVSSVYMREAYAAYQSGIKAAWKLIVFVGDYDDQVVVEFRDKLYNVYRVYHEGDNVELYLRADTSTWQGVAIGGGGANDNTG
jgi:SPP1 family predicted phage head-tail adaptor